MKTTNVTRFLDDRNVEYTVQELPERKFGAVETAQFLGIPEDEVYKTIVTRGKDSGRTVLVLVSADTEVDLKALANLLGEKKMLKLSQREAEKVTGLKAGGISPLALINKGFKVIIDETAIAKESINISGGQWGLTLQISPLNLAEITRAKFAPVSQMKN